MTRRVVVTRAPHQSGELADRLVARGMVPLLYPCIDIAPPADVQRLESALRQNFDWLILTSENTVHALAKHTINQAFWRQVAAVGEATAQAARHVLNVEISFVATEQTGENLAQTLPLVTRSTIFLPQSEIAPATIADILRERGALVTAVTAYRTVIGSGGVDLPALLRSSAVDAITLASGSAARNLIRRVGSVDLLHRVPIVCIGTSTAQAARASGLTNLLIPEQFSLAAMVALLEKNFRL